MLISDAAPIFDCNGHFEIQSHPFEVGVPLIAPFGALALLLLPSGIAGLLFLLTAVVLLLLFGASVL